MNIYAVIILSALAAEFILNLAADILNLKHLSTDLPREFQDVFDAERYGKTQAYTRVNTHFGWITSAFGLAVTLAFWFSGGFNALDSWIRGWGLHPVWNGLFFIGILILGRSLLSLPFGVYDTFVIEERFGFNRTIPKTFVLDLVKALFLSVLIGGPLLAGVLAFFEYAGRWAWLWCWIVTALFSLFLRYVAPTWIMPLFNKFTPLEEGELKKRILDYAAKVRYKLSGIVVMDGSKRSGKSNAFFTGFGKNKRIALFDTLIEKQSPQELVAVLAHEIGHDRKKHILIGTAVGIVHTGVLFFLLSLFLTRQGLFDAFFMDHRSVYAGMLFFGMLYAPVELLLSIGMHAVSRRHEFAADRFSALTTCDPESLVSALKKLSAHNLSNLTPHPFYVFLNHSHPPVLERIRALNRPEPG